MFRERDDKCGVDVLGNSCIACLAHLAILYEAVGRMGPAAQPEMYNLCDSALQRLGTLTSDLRFEEYTYLDLLLGVRLFLRCFPMVKTQMGKMHRTLGENPYQSLTSAYRAYPSRPVDHYDTSGRSSRKRTPIFTPGSPITSRRYYIPWLRWRTVPQRSQNTRA
jgi:hypothetical protein